MLFLLCIVIVNIWFCFAISLCSSDLACVAKSDKGD